MYSEKLTETTRTVTFDDWQSLIEYVTVKPQIHDVGRQFAAKKRKSAQFDAHTSWDQAIELASNGWQEGADKAKAIADPLFHRVSQLIERQDMVHDVEGISIDIGRYVEGEPECWQRWDSHITDGPGVRIIKIGYNLCASGGVDANIITARGAVVAALVELMEYAGNRVELHAIFSAFDHQKYTDTMSVLVKSADQPLNSSRVAFALAHPAMLRRIAFEVQEHMPKERWFGVGRGQPNDVSATDYDIYLGKMEYGEWQWTSQESTQQWCISELEKQGISLRKGDS